LSDVSGVVGTALAEQRLDILTQTINDVAGLGSTGDAGICGRQSQSFHCFPQRLRPEVFTVPVQQGGKPLPISLAFQGKTGVVRSIDYRGKEVLAAYGPIGSLGLGMSLKMDAAEIYAPVRERLELFVPLLLALVITGAMVLRMQLRPLVAELLKSREALRERTVELERTNADLERASHAKDRFLATMSHELRTPLNAILGFTGTLLMRLPGALTNTQEEQLRTVQAAGKHLLSLINDLLDLASIESGKVVMKRETVECEEVLNELANALRPLAERKGLRLDCRFGTAIAPLRTDRRALLQILMNLTNNAIKYTSSGTVAIECNQREDGCKVATDITVIDTGVGIKQEEQEQLFNAFARVGDSRTHQEGTGLGLYYSRKLAELLGARITFASEFGSGTRFTLTL
jgi:signal transduction histidine kinase